MQTVTDRLTKTWKNPKPAADVLNSVAKSVWHASEATTYAFKALRHVPSAAVSDALSQSVFVTNDLIRPAIRGCQLIGDLKQAYVYATDGSQWKRILFESLPLLVFRGAATISSLAALAHWFQPDSLFDKISTQAFGVARLTLPALWASQLKQFAWDSDPGRKPTKMNNHRELVRLGADMFADGAIYFGLAFIPGAPNRNFVIGHLIGIGSVALNLYAEWPALRDQP